MATSIQACGYTTPPLLLAADTQEKSVITPLFFLQSKEWGEGKGKEGEEDNKPTPCMNSHVHTYSSIDSTFYASLHATHTHAHIYGISYTVAHT